MRILIRIGATRTWRVETAARVLTIFVMLLVFLPCFATAAPQTYRGWTNGRGYPAANTRVQTLAERGDARAQTVLGFAYETGRGVPQNFVSAVKWYRRAAAKGNPTAQYLLGLMYDYGRGVPEDKIIAQKWLILAAARASGRERAYYVRIRDAVASAMSSGEIAQAQYLAHQWTAKHKRP